MKKAVGLISCVLILGGAVKAAPKVHVVAFGKWSSIVIPRVNGDGGSIELKMRPLFVDGHSKEFTIGPAHEVTEHSFVVQRIYRVNDSLPQDSGPTRWSWQRGDWIQIDRASGRVQPVTLPEFDPEGPNVIWFRNFAAYWGVTDDGRKSVAMIVQLGRRKPLLKKAIGEINGPPENFATPIWERDPVRVTFQPKPDQKLTFSVTTRAVDAFAGEAEETEE